MMALSIEKLSLGRPAMFQDWISTGFPSDLANEYSPGENGNFKF